ncbi:MAG: DHH family phosphoesterase [bacterium]
MRGEKVWRVREVDERKIENLKKELSVSRLVALLLVARGIQTAEDAATFLNPSLGAIHNPNRMAGMREAVVLIDEAIDRGKRILIWGHEDADGIASIGILRDTIRDLRGDACYYVPNRLREGHGLSEAGIRKARQSGVDLIVTVDCGISNVDPATAARELGVGLAITDHHEILGSLPRADAVVDPKRPDCQYPFKELAGCGVALKLAQALVKNRLGLNVKQWLDSRGDILGLAVLGTISDKVPLVDENRILVSFGLKALMDSKRPGIKAIREKAEEHLDKVPTATEIVRLTVQILSSGRSQTGVNQSCELLLTENQDKAEDFVQALLKGSQKWQSEAKKAYVKASRSLGPVSSNKILVVVDEEAPCYLLGYCASRLKEDHTKPVVAIGFRGNVAIGECRGPNGFDFVDCLKSCGRLFIDYGGHKQAAGFSASRDRIAELQEAFDSYAANNVTDDTIQRPILWIDCEFPLSEMGPELAEEITRLAPFGEGNPQPLFISRKARLERKERGYIFDSGNKKLFIRKGSPVGDWVDLSGDIVELDVVYSVDEAGELILRDCRPSAFGDWPKGSL